MKKRIYLSPPHLDENAMVCLNDAVQSNWIAPVGPDVDAFESELASVLKIGHVLATNSGTSAIHLGLIALGVGPGDEVLCSTFTFCATINPVVYCGATPVLIDSESETWNMDPTILEEAIHDRIRKTGRTPRAIVVVHLYGMPARMQAIMTIARQFQIPVLEDAAEALGSLHDGSPVGTAGDAGIVSFNGNKIITTSGGGALFSSSLTLIDKARYLRGEAREPVPYYEHKSIGYNYRLSNLLAALGRSQLKILSQRVSRRRQIFEFYRDELEGVSVCTFQEEGRGVQSNRWLSTVVFNDGTVDIEGIRLALETEGIECRRLWKPMHLQPVFRNCPAYVRGVSEGLFDHGLCLPSGTAMTEDDLVRVVSVIKDMIYEASKGI